MLYTPISCQVAGKDHYVFAFVLEWQYKVRFCTLVTSPDAEVHQMLYNYDWIACLDSTHNTCFSALGQSKKAFLYTVVVRNLISSSAAPAAFMITPSEAQYAITNFLGWLWQDLGFLALSWIIDCSNVEAAGICNGQGPQVKIFFCYWHVLEALAKELSQKLTVSILY